MTSWSILDHYFILWSNTYLLMYLSRPAMVLSIILIIYILTLADELNELKSQNLSSCYQSKYSTVCMEKQQVYISPKPNQVIYLGDGSNTMNYIHAFICLIVVEWYKKKIIFLRRYIIYFYDFQGQNKEKCSQFYLPSSGSNTGYPKPRILPLLPILPLMFERR